MFNLLPQAEKDALRREYRRRLAAVFLWLLAAAILIASALLLPSYIFSAQKEKVAAQRAEVLSRRTAREETVAENAVLQLAQEKLDLAKSSAPSPPRFHFERIAAVARNKPTGISLSGFSVVPVEEGKQAFFINGRAAERAALVSFALSLEQTGLFEKVEVPLPLLAKESGIEFSLRATGSF